ncbi:MAG: hypothetical protein WD889_02200 [Candidatus Colwellbacteria bacterium]
MKRIKYPNIILFLLSVALAIVLSRVGVFDTMAHLGDFDYLGAFISGLLLPFTFATPLATASFFYLGQANSIWSIIAVGSIGALVSDLIIWRFFKGGIFTEFENIWGRYQNYEKRRHHFSHIHRPHLIQLFHTRPFHFLSLFLAVMVLFSPLPDEIGLEMLAYYHLKPQRLIILSLVSSAVAIWLAVNAGRLVLG